MKTPRRLASVCGAALLLGLALHTVAAGPCDGDDLPQRSLALVNRLRADGAVCGGKAAAPAPPLAWSEAAAAAARGHALDMALKGRMAHAGSDRQQGGERLRRAGLEWQRWAENLGVSRAAGRKIARSNRGAQPDAVGQWNRAPQHLFA